MNKGIIIGLNATIEYLLPFFYVNLRLHTDLPITFYDYGMSNIGRSFCEKRGEVVEVSQSLYVTDIQTQESMIRQAWFKKPLSCQIAPYDLNLWIDLDMFVRGPLDPIFDALTEDKHIAICQEYEVKISKKHRSLKSNTITDIKLLRMLSLLKGSQKHSKHIPEKIPIFNSGLFAFKKNSPFIAEWIKQSEYYSQTPDILRVGDQDTLSFVLFDSPAIVASLPKTYNFLINSPRHLKNHSPLDVKLFPVKSYKALNLSPLEASNIHFCCNAKTNFLHRYLHFEQLAKKTSQSTKASHVS